MRSSSALCCRPNSCSCVRMATYFLELGSSLVIAGMEVDGELAGAESVCPAGLDRRFGRRFAGGSAAGSNDLILRTAFPWPSPLPEAAKSGFKSLELVWPTPPLVAPAISTRADANTALMRAWSDAETDARCLAVRACPALPCGEWPLSSAFPADQFRWPVEGAAAAAAACGSTVNV